MKVRNGFVSNSSSSSFIVGFKKVPTTIKEMQKMLFEHIKKYGLADWEWKDWVDTADIARLVLEDIRNNKELTKSQFVDEFIEFNPEDSDEFTFGYRDFSEIPNNLNWDMIPIENRAEEFKKYLLNKKLFAAKMYDECIAPLIDELTFYCFEFDDSTNIGCIMENGKIFRNLSYMRIMKH